MRVLIVDDEKNILSAMQRMLGDCCSVDCACSAVEAVEKAKAGEYDFVLLDFMMPQRDGLWFMNNCRFHRKTKVILLTGYLNKELVKQMFKLGVSSYMVKPVSREDVLRQFDYLSKPCPVETVPATSSRP